MIAYLTVNTVAEAFCLLVSLFCLFKDKDLLWRLLIAYLSLTLITEVSGIYVRKTFHQSNIYLYNIFLVVECITISTFFYNLYKQYVNRLTWLIIWLLIFSLFFVSELIFNQFTGFVSKTASLLSVIFVLAGLYFYYLVLRDEHYVNLDRYAPFWWVSGTLIFYFGSTATNIFLDYLVHDQIAVFHYSIRYITFSILNVLLYCCWSYSFICRYLQRKFIS
jgi:hypothetical protein